MPVITEDVVQANRGRKCDSTANGMNISYIKNKSCSEEEEENTGIRFNEPATIFVIRHTMTNSSSIQAAAAVYAATTTPAAMQ